MWAGRNAKPKPTSSSGSSGRPSGGPVRDIERDTAAAPRVYPRKTQISPPAPAGSPFRGNRTPCPRSRTRVNPLPPPPQHAATTPCPARRDHRPLPGAEQGFVRVLVPCYGRCAAAQARAHGPAGAPSVTPADVAPEAQSGLAAFLARPAAAHAAGQGQEPGPATLAAAAAAPRPSGAGPGCRRPTRVRVDPSSGDARDTQARPRPRPVPRGGRRGVRTLLTAAPAAAAACFPTPEKRRRRLAIPGAHAGPVTVAAPAGAGPGAGGRLRPTDARTRGGAHGRPRRGGTGEFVSPPSSLSSFFVPGPCLVMTSSSS